MFDSILSSLDCRTRAVPPQSPRRTSFHTPPSSQICAQDPVSRSYDGQISRFDSDTWFLDSQSRWMESEITVLTSVMIARVSRVIARLCQSPEVISHTTALMTVLFPLVWQTIRQMSVMTGRLCHTTGVVSDTLRIVSVSRGLMCLTRGVLCLAKNELWLSKNERSLPIEMRIGPDRDGSDDHLDAHGSPEHYLASKRSVRRRAIERAIQMAARRDVVLICGKGHERTQTAAGRRTTFSDVDVAREILREKPEAEIT